MLKRIFIAFLFLSLSLSLSAYAQDLRINNKQVDEGDLVNLFASDLAVPGLVNFSVRADKLQKAEITFDKGRNWAPMEKDGDRFVFDHRSTSDEVLLAEFLFTNEDGSIRTYKPNVRVSYQKKNPDEAVIQLLEKFKLYYEQENIDRFMSLFSMLFPDRVKFQEAIQNDFYNYRNIRLFYRAARKTFDEDYEGAIWDVYWERKCDTISGTSLDDSAIISMQIEKEGSVWLVKGLRNNTIFGSSLLALPELSITNADVNLFPPPPTLQYRVETTVHNIGSAPASGIRVDFSYAPTVAGPWNFEGFQTITGPLNPGSSIMVTHYTAVMNPTAFKVVVDPLGAIQESDTSNNTVTKFFP